MVVVPGAGVVAVVAVAAGAGDDVVGAGVEGLARIGWGVADVVVVGAGEATAGAPVG